MKDIQINKKKQKKINLLCIQWTTGILGQAYGGGEQLAQAVGEGGAGETERERERESVSSCGKADLW